MDEDDLAHPVPFFLQGAMNSIEPEPRIKKKRSTLNPTAIGKLPIVFSPFTSNVVGIRPAAAT